jgi:hypothetical protein
VAERSGGAVGIGRREVGDGADMWAPLGGDRGEGVISGLRHVKKETHFGQCATAPQARTVGPSWAGEVGGLGRPVGQGRGGAGRLGRRSCRAARSAGPKARKRISELKLDF